jgi:AraC-like DNA-binding protein
MKRQSTIRPDPDQPGVSVQQWSGDGWDEIAYFPKRYQIGMVETGQLTLAYKEQVYSFDNQTIFIIRPGLIHSVVNDETTGGSVTSVNLEPPALVSLAAGLSVDLADVAFPDSLALVDSAANLPVRNSFLAYAHQLIQPVVGFETSTLLTEAVGQLLAAFDVGEVADDQGQTQVIDRAKAYLQIHFRGKVSLDDLAEHSYLSKYHLLRLFKAQTGLTPHLYQTHLRLNEARKRLMRGHPLADVAFELGFTDQAHFIHTFKRYTEFSPKKYRDQLRNFLQVLPS